MKWIWLSAMYCQKVVSNIFIFLAAYDSFKKVKQTNGRILSTTGGLGLNATARESKRLIEVGTIHCREVGIEYKSGFEKDEQEEDQKEMSMIRNALSKSSDKPAARPAMREAPREEPKQQMEMDLSEPEAAPRGLMARV